MGPESALLEEPLVACLCFLSGSELVLLEDLVGADLYGSGGMSPFTSPMLSFFRLGVWVSLWPGLPGLSAKAPAGRLNDSNKLSTEVSNVDSVAQVDPKTDELLGKNIGSLPLLPAPFAKRYFLGADGHWRA